MKLYSKLVKPLLFLLDPEAAHHFVAGFLKVIFRVPGISNIIHSTFSIDSPSLRKKVFGIDFPNPVGLAAGFDKDASLYNELSSFGFGFIEVGTVTPKAQPGNPKPRMFRLPDDEALINRMGFNNEGVHAMVSRLRSRNKTLIIGGNIGKNKDTPNEKAAEDYEFCFRALYDHVDYFVVNVSSPNTAGLRDLQEKDPLLKILQRLQSVNLELAKSKPDLTEERTKPILLKISPDLSQHALDEVIDVCLECKLAGIIATNTTISRKDLTTSENEVEKFGAGGLSGKPVKSRSTEVIKYINERAGGKLIIIGTGGIHSAEEAIEKLKAGASLIQLYTGFVYEGPSLIKRINKKILSDKISV